MTGRFRIAPASLEHPDSIDRGVEKVVAAIAHVPRSKEEILLRRIDLAKATRLYAKRFNPEWYPRED